MSTLSVTIIQADLFWQDAERNREQFSVAIENVEEATDLIVLPEMFSTGFSMDAPSLAETMDGKTIDWLTETAEAKRSAICGSLIISEGGHFFNRFICIEPGGAMTTYDKRHLFRLADEHNHYTQGNAIQTFELKGFRICPMICYDLRFPVWSRNRDNYDLLLYVANWPSRRHNAWTTLLRARAIENLSYLAGVNRVGLDGNELPYIGGSSIVDYLGNDLANLAESKGTATATLDLDALQKFRDRFAFHKDADAFTLDN